MGIALRGVFVLGLTAAAGAFAQPAGKGASDYPSRPIRFVIPYTPAGSADIFARVISPKMTEALGQQVVVDNRGGSSGIIGTEIAARAPADGYTLLMGITANMTINPSLYAKLPYDPVRDFTPITLVATAPYALVTPPSLPARSVKELLALAKAKPGELAFSSDGNGSIGHLGGELFASMADVKLLHVPYKTTAQIFADLMSGQVQLMFLGAVSSQPHVKSGKLRALAVSSSKRFALMPDTPTVAEAGVPGFELTGWYGVYVPAGTPRPIVNRLHGDIVRVLNQPDVRERLSGMGAELVGNTPEQFAAFMQSEIAKWARAVKLSGAKAE